MRQSGIGERADELRSAIDVLASVRQTAIDSQAVTTRADQLEELAFALESQTVLLKLFRDQGLEPFVSRRRVDSLLSLTRSHRTKFNQNRSSIAADPEDSGMKWRYRDEMQRLNRSIEKSLDESWRAYVDSLIPARLDEQLAILSRVPVLSRQVARMRQLGIQLQEARKRTPSDFRAFEQVSAAASELNNLWKELSGIPDEVRIFLAAASAEGAEIDALTTTVREWLAKSDLDRSLRYVLRSNP